MSRAVPTVDLSAPDADQRLADGLTVLGFVELINHGASPAAAADLRDVCDRFFSLDPATKAGYTHPDPIANRGYRAKGSEALSYSLGAPSRPDLFESFNCGPDDRVGTDPLPLIQPTPWPDADVPGYADAAGRWLGEMAALSARLDSLIDSQLGTTLAADSTAGPDTMACIDYRPGPDGVERAVDGQQRMGAHSDYTTFTLLAADPVPGLQIVGAGGSWIDVLPSPGSLLMNVGDLLAMYTNDTWPSTLHRVVPMAHGCAPVRRSVAYFHYPDLGVTVAPLPHLTGDGGPRYEPVTVADHLLAKLAAPKTRRRSTGASTAAGRSIN